MKRDARPIYKKPWFVAVLASCMALRPIRQRIMLGWWLVFGSGLYIQKTPLVESIMDYIISVELRMPDRSSAIPPVHYINAEDYSSERLWDAGSRMTECTVVRGMLNTARSRKWGSKEWIERYGNQSVIANMKTKGDADSHKEYYALGDTTLGQIDTDIQNDIVRMSYGLDEIFINNPELAKEVEVERFGFGDARSCRQLGLLYGKAGAGKGGGLMFHNAGSGNFLMQVSGYKLVRLISNTHSLLIKPVLAGEFDSGYLASSPWDLIESLPITDVILAPGDMLHFPSWLWHATETVDAPENEPAVPEGQEERQVKIAAGITCRFPTVWASMHNDPMLEFFRTFGRNTMGMPKAMPGVFHWVPFMRQMVDAKNYWFGTMPPWDDLQDCWSSKRTACRNRGITLA